MPVCSIFNKQGICLIQYTGGTTGLPKGVELTQHNIFSNLTQVKTWTGFEMAKDVLCSGFPFFHLGPWKEIIAPDGAGFWFVFKARWSEYIEI